MNFSSPLFVFLFLPAVLILYAVLPGIRAKNSWLLLVSLVFYAWGETGFVLLLLVSTALNFSLGLLVERCPDARARKAALVAAICLNLGLLAFFKYTNFAVHLLDTTLHGFGLPGLPPTHIPLPIGISFFTFHALSYIGDIYRGKWKAATDPRDVALYIFFFPQLVAGPILRWSGIAPQLARREYSREAFAEGIRRFTGGLAKKVLIANTLAVPADQIFALSAAELSGTDAWLGIICYTLQIYFDFSGYSDMAVGLGKMFGFTFLENFQWPYTAGSIREFWRCWHISLSTWFRDYLYIPLGGNQRSERRTYLNLLLVFFLCGLWHGASITFVIWGLYHGLFLVLERTRWGAVQEKLTPLLRHTYTLSVVMVGWVIFRAETFAAMRHYFVALFGMAPESAPQPYIRYATPQVLTAICLGAVFCGPTWNWIQRACDYTLGRAPAALRVPLHVGGLTVELGLIIVLLALSAAWLASGTYNPFIYYRF